MSEVKLDHLTKRFPGGTLAVDDISLTVADGEFLVLVGPSGCGKSTVLRMIAGLEEATAGDISVGGQVVTDLAPKERDIAMVFQNYALYPHMTVAQNLGFSLRLRRTPKDEMRQQVNDTAHLLGLQELLDRKPAALSGGQRQRVAMGRAMVRQPRVFLMDEPLSNLDAKLRVSMRGELMRLHQQYRITTIYVTHDQIEAMTLGDRIAVLEKGRLQQVGTPEELYFAPANRFVAGFMGSPAMNLATAQVRAGDPITLDVAGNIWPLPDALHRWPGLARYVDGTVTLGLRPDAFSLGGPDSEAPIITVTPIGVESLGDEKHVLFAPPDTKGSTAGALLAIDESAAAEMWTAKAGPHADLAIGREVTLAVDLTSAYFFDPDTGAVVPARREPLTQGVQPAAKESVRV
jgi:multiple sugar transport system ATP-binding protein